MRHAALATHYIHSKHLPQVHQSLINLGPAASDPGAPAALRGGAALVQAGLTACVHNGRADVAPLHTCLCAGTVGELLTSFEKQEPLPEGQLESMR